MGYPPCTGNGTAAAAGRAAWLNMFTLAGGVVNGSSSVPRQKSANAQANYVEPYTLPSGPTHLNCYMSK